MATDSLRPLVYKEVGAKIRFGIELGDWNDPAVRKLYDEGHAFEGDPLTWAQMHEFLGHWQLEFLRLYEAALRTEEGQKLAARGPYAVAKTVMELMAGENTPGKFEDYREPAEALRKKLKEDEGEEEDPIKELASESAELLAAIDTVVLSNIGYVLALVLIVGAIVLAAAGIFLSG
jgi:hypothetical protein